MILKTSQNNVENAKLNENLYGDVAYISAIRFSKYIPTIYVYIIDTYTS